MGNYSKQREEIINILKESYSHPTAEEVYLLAKEKNPNISRGTVYRNLNNLVEKGEIIKIDMSDSDRFDYMKDDHSHVICAECGRVIDYHHDFDMDNISKEIRTQSGLEFFSCNIAIKGICDKCNNKNKEE